MSFDIASILVAMTLTMVTMALALFAVMDGADRAARLAQVSAGLQSERTTEVSEFKCQTCPSPGLTGSASQPPRSSNPRARSHSSARRGHSDAVPSPSPMPIPCEPCSNSSISAGTLARVSAW